jgi:hypothetical protein
MALQEAWDAEEEKKFENEAWLYADARTRGTTRLRRNGRITCKPSAKHVVFAGDFRG